MPPKAQAWARLSESDQLAAVRQLVTAGHAASTMAFRLSAPPKEIAKLATRVRRELEQEAQAQDGGLASDPTGEEEPAAEEPADPEPAREPEPSAEPAVVEAGGSDVIAGPTAETAPEPAPAVEAAPPAETPPHAEQARGEDGGNAAPEQNPWLAYDGTLDWRFIEPAQRLLLLAAGIRAGLTANQIAERFRYVTRNAICGLAHRKGLHFKSGTFSNRISKPKAPPAARAPKFQEPSAGPGRKMKLIAGVPQVAIGSGPRAASQWDFKARAEQRAASVGLAEHLVTGEARRPVDDFTVPISRRLKLVELTERTCKWPHGDPRDDDFAFCGHDTGDGPYCAYHTRLAYTPLSQRQAATIRSAERIR